MFKYIYRISDTTVVNKVDEYIDVDLYYRYYPEEFKSSIRTLISEEDINVAEIFNYKVVNEELVRMSDEEIQELRLYAKILTEEERLLNQLKPPYEEVAKAKNTIEMINLIQEVM